MTCYNSNTNIYRFSASVSIPALSSKLTSSSPLNFNPPFSPLQHLFSILPLSYHSSFIIHYSSLSHINITTAAILDHRCSFSGVNCLNILLLICKWM
ncbi:hypothetical protein QVD17_10486 [Tagetes erecta]|uniref:Uncharacterized protein n=1 Tax=Tagetes erecta TaxID=13708 RepID=A0AAD8L176_TARER|nr:hypothetical protein QVD17_10486 [Tagetes erecta]